VIYIAKATDFLISKFCAHLHSGHFTVDLTPKKERKTSHRDTAQLNRQHGAEKG
jgi:hypothetical protein